jgi:DNA-binding LacI/PurR family transcriptional regulator
MRDLLYVAPRHVAQTGVIGLLLPELSNPVFPAFAEAMEKRAAALGYALILCHTDGSAEAETEYVHTLLERRADGMIFVSCQMADLDADHSHYETLLEQGARLVFVNGSVDTFPVPSVGVDERRAGALATEHLIALGHRRIGFVAGPSHYIPTREKEAGYREAMKLADLDPEVIVHDDFSVEGGRRAMRSILERNRGAYPTGVICSSDLMAIGALREAADHGMRVPEELSIVGFDGIDACAWMQPSLTTIAQPIQEIADAAVSALHSLITNPDKPLPHFVFRPELRVGASTAAPPVETP